MSDKVFEEGVGTHVFGAFFNLSDPEINHKPCPGIEGPKVFARFVLGEGSSGLLHMLKQADELLEFWYQCRKGTLA